MRPFEDDGIRRREPLLGRWTATLRANGDAAATLLDAWDGRRVPCGCGDAEQPPALGAPAPAAPVERRPEQPRTRSRRRASRI